MRVINVQGNHFQMGLQHGLQVKDLRPFILKAIESQLEPLEGMKGLGGQLEQLMEMFQDASTSTLDMIRGQAKGLDLDFQTLLKYDCAAYLNSLLVSRSRVEEECSTWAASKDATGSGDPILVKNRDYYLEHLPLQLVVQAGPEDGYRYLCVSSAGRPGVPVSGMNENGLCVADTRDQCLAYGLGLPYYSLMMHILEEHGNVRSALEYLKRAKRMGGNNLILADADGELAVFEMGHDSYGLVEAENHILVNANHCVSPSLQHLVVESVFPQLTESSLYRYERIRHELQTSHGKIDVALAKGLMASHNGPQSSICRHDSGFMGKKIGTLSCAIYLPGARRLLFSDGPPCQEKYQTFDLSES